MQVVLGIVRRFPIWTAIGVFSLVGFVFHDFLSGSVEDLKVGECFDVPAGVTTLKDVQHHPCTSRHDAEMIYIGSISGSTATYAGDAAFEAFAKANCVPAFNSYLGRDFDTDEIYDMTFLYPTTDGWTNGDRVINCFVVRIDGHQMTATVRAP